MITKLLAYGISLLMAVTTVCGSNEYHFESISTPYKESISEMTEDHLGYIWLATDNGTIRYDGKQYTRYEVKNGNGQPSNNCIAIKEDSRHNLWVGTTSGLALLDRTHGYMRAYTINKKPDGIISIAEDADHTLWLLGYNALYHYNVRTHLCKTLPGKWGTRIAVTKTDVWAASETNGITLIDKHTLRHRTLTEGIGRHIFRLLATSDGNVAAGTIDDGVYLLNQQGKVLQHLSANQPNGFNSKNISALCESDKGTMWIGCISGNLAAYDLKKRQFVDIRQKYPQKIKANALTISSILYDSHHNLWLGTVGYWMLKRNQSDNLFSYASREQQPTITSFCEDANNRLWVGSDGNGYAPYDPMTGQSGNGSKKTIASLRRQGNQLWIASWGNGVIIKDTRTGQETKIKGLPGNGIHDALPVKGGAWIAIDYYGLVYYDQKTGKISSRLNSKLPVFSAKNPQFAMQLLQDSKGQIWAATSDGLCCWNGHSYYRYGYKDGHDQEILSVIEDHDHQIWFISKRNGLNKVDEKHQTFINYNTRYRLPNELKSMAEDRHGNLWICSSDHLFCISHNTHIVHDYALNNVLGNDAFNTRAFYIDQKGTIYAGATGGVLTVHSEKIPPVAARQQVTLTSFNIYNQRQEAAENGILTKDISLIEELELGYEQKIFSFGFQCINYDQSEQLEYYYKLEGLSDTWIKADPTQTATFSGLKWGTYHLDVKAVTSSGEVGHLSHPLKLVILPPWWATWWFRGIMALLVLIAFQAITRYRIQYIEHQRQRLSQQVSERTQELAQRNEEITQQKQNLEKKNEELDEALKTKDRIMSVIAHDLRNPMTIVTGMLELLRRDKEVNQSANLSKQVGTVSHAASHLQNEMENLLQWVRMKGDAILYAPHDVYLNTLVADNIQLLQDLLQQKEISINLSDSSQTSAYCDDRMIATVIRDLLQNAIKFSQRKSEIEILLSETENQIILKIQDHGMGMTAERSQHLFDGGEITSTEGTEKEKGSGLGLKICHNFISKNKGDITVSSEEGKGSTFSISLPKGTLRKQAKTADLPECKETEEEKEAEQKNLLLVDDDPDLLDYLTLIFRTEYNITTAHNGAEALEIAKTTLPDLILSDMMMPEMDGQELCSRLKSDPMTQHIPVLILTSNDTNESQIESFRTGADDYIIKPFNKELLQAKLRTVLENQERQMTHYRNLLLKLKPGELPQSKDDTFMQKVNEVIKVNVGNENFTVETLADQTAMSRMQLFRKFKAIAGCTPSEYIRQYRMLYAAQLLEKHSMNIQEIAYAVGFSDPKYFSNCFSDKFGMTPTQYAKEHK